MDEQKEIRYRILYTEMDIRRAVKNMSELIAEDVTPNDIFVCLLNGGIFFYSDLLKQLCLRGIPDIKLNFLSVHSGEDAWGNKVAEVLDHHFTSNIIEDINNGGNVWIIDEIIDSGRSVTAVINWFGNKIAHNKERIPNFNVVTMLQRAGAVYDDRVNANFYGFRENRKEWFAGYGMDGSDGKMRAFPGIAIELPDDDVNDSE